MDACAYQLKHRELKQVIIVNTDLGMRKGKTSSQVAHASLIAGVLAFNKYPELYDEYHQTGHKKIVVGATKNEMLDLEIPMQIPFAIVYDQGLTQIPPDSLTAVAIGPWYADEIDAITDKFKLVN
jgi:PTH2 family peptidyl-tRNA hydrolase